METTKWHSTDPIEKLVVSEALGGKEATLTPSESAGAGALINVPDALRKEGFSVDILRSGGQVALKIRGDFGPNNDTLLDCIESTGAVSPRDRHTTETSLNHADRVLAGTAPSSGHSR